MDSVGLVPVSPFVHNPLGYVCTRHSTIALALGGTSSIGLVIRCYLGVTAECAVLHCIVTLEKVYCLSVTVVLKHILWHPLYVSTFLKAACVHFVFYFPMCLCSYLDLLLF